MKAHIHECLKTDQVGPTSLGPDLAVWKALDGTSGHLILTSYVAHDITEPTVLSGLGWLTLKKLTLQHLRERCKVCES